MIYSFDDGPEDENAGVPFPEPEEPTEEIPTPEGASEQ